MLNEERSSDFARRYAAALLAEGRDRLRDEVPSVPGELVAEVLWGIEAALPHVSRGQFELELLEINKHKGAGWRRYTTARRRIGEEAGSWKNWAQTRKQIARHHARIDESSDSTSWNPATSDLATISTKPASASTNNSNGGRDSSVIDKPLSKGFAGDGAPMTFSKLRRIVIRAQVLFIEYAKQRCNENAERLCGMLRHQSTALLAQLEAINAWEACHRTLRQAMSAGAPLMNEQVLFDQEFQKLQGETFRDFPGRLKKETDSLATLRKNYGTVSTARK